MKLGAAQLQAQHLQDRVNDLEAQRAAGAESSLWTVEQLEAQVRAPNFIPK